MMDEFTMTLTSPLTEEQWDMITDVDFDHTRNIWFNTKHGEKVEFVKVVRCRECKYRAEDDFCTGRGWPDQLVADDGFCEKGKRKDGGQDD